MSRERGVSKIADSVTAMSTTGAIRAAQDSDYDIWEREEFDARSTMTRI